MGKEFYKMPDFDKMYLMVKPKLRCLIREPMPNNKKNKASRRIEAKYKRIFGKDKVKLYLNVKRNTFDIYAEFPVVIRLKSEKDLEKLRIALNNTDFSNWTMFPEGGIKNEN